MKPHRSIGILDSSTSKKRTHVGKQVFNHSLSASRRTSHEATAMPLGIPACQTGFRMVIKYYVSMWLEKISCTKILVFFILGLLCQQVSAQQLEGNVDFHGFADNREYGASDRYPQTIFGARITPEVGLLVDGVHRIRAGVSYLHEFGTKNILKPVRPVAYYNYMDKGFDFKIGMFPRHEYLDEYPKAILSDTIGYYQPNIEGMLVRYSNENFHQQLWIDWNSRQTRVDREQFMVGLSGNVHLGSLFYVKHFAALWHNAGVMADQSDPDDHIRDNGAASLHLGIDLSDKNWLDSINVNVGGIINYDRLRNVYDWQTPKGFISELYVEHSRFFVRNTFYTGQSLSIPYGDVFYTSKQYNRLDVGWVPLRNKNLEGRFTAGFHFSEGVMDNQQQFILRYNIGKSLK